MLENVFSEGARNPSHRLLGNGCECWSDKGGMCGRGDLRHSALSDEKRGERPILNSLRPAQLLGQSGPTHSLLIQSKRHRSGSDFLCSYPEERVPTRVSPIARANRDTAIAEVARHKRHPLYLQ